MNARFNAMLEGAQRDYDNRLPPPVSETPEEFARAEWIENGVEQLVDFCSDVKFKRLGHSQQGVTFKRFAEEVEQFAISSPCRNPSAIGEMIIGIIVGSSVARGGAFDLMAVPDPKERLRVIARRLLSPLADDALIAQAEDAEL